MNPEVKTPGAYTGHINVSDKNELDLVGTIRRGKSLTKSTRGFHVAHRNVVEWM